MAPVVAEHDPAPAPHVVEDPVGNATVCAVAAAAAVVPEVSFSLGYFYLLFLTYSGVFRFFSGFFLLFAPFFFFTQFLSIGLCAHSLYCVHCIIFIFGYSVVRVYMALPSVFLSSVHTCEEGQ